MNNININRSALFYFCIINGNRPFLFHIAGCSHPEILVDKYPILGSHQEHNTKRGKNDILFRDQEPQKSYSIPWRISTGLQPICGSTPPCPQGQQQPKTIFLNDAHYPQRSCCPCHFLLNMQCNYSPKRDDLLQHSLAMLFKNRDTTFLAPLNHFSHIRQTIT